MKKIKCFLWSMVVICLSATMPLYGGDSDDDLRNDDLGSAPKAKFEEVAPPAGGQAFALLKTFEEIQSEFKGSVRVPTTNAEEVFEEIKESFRKQSKSDFRGLCRGLWDGIPFRGNPRADII